MIVILGVSLLLALEDQGSDVTETDEAREKDREEGGWKGEGGD